MGEGYPDSLAGWGAPAIFKEAGRLLGKYFRLLHPFIAAFLLPVVVIELLELWGFAWGISHFQHHHHHHPHPHPHPHLHPHHHHGHHHPHHPMGGFFRAFYIHSHEGGGPGVNENLYAPAPAPHPHPPPPPPLLPLLLVIAISLLVWLLTSLAIASISQAIAHIYSQDPPADSQGPSITKSIFKSLPSALYRIFITTLFIILFAFVTTSLLSLPFHFLNYFLHSKVVIIINQIILQIAWIILSFVFLLALEVAVLEPENYGSAALRRSWKLVQSKLGASLVFFLVNIVLGGVLSKLAEGVIFWPVSGKLPFWTVYVLGVAWALIYLVFTVYFLVVAVVLYFATKLKVESEGEYLPVNTREEYAPPVADEP